MNVNQSEEIFKIVAKLPYDSDFWDKKLGGYSMQFCFSDNWTSYLDVLHGTNNNTDYQKNNWYKTESCEEWYKKQEKYWTSKMIDIIENGLNGGDNDEK